MSHVVIENRHLAAWCQAVLKNIERVRERNRVTYLVEHSKKQHRSWFRRLLREPAQTPEEIRKDLETLDKQGKLDFFHDWCGIGWRGGRAEEVAKRLLHAIQVSRAITVTSDDLKYLHDWEPDGYSEGILREPGYRD